jgi:hypothetical protein
VKLSPINRHESPDFGTGRQQNGGGTVFLGARPSHQPQSDFFLQHDHSIINQIGMGDQPEKKRTGNGVGQVGHDLEPLSRFRQGCQVDLEDIGVQQSDVGREILLLLVEADDARVCLKADDRACRCGQRLGEGSQADPNLDDLVVWMQSGQIDYALRGVGMNQKILAQFLVRGQSLMLEHLFGREMCHVSSAASGRRHRCPQ